MGSMEWSEWALSLAVFIPAVGAVVTILIPRAQEELIKWVSLVTTLGTLGVVVGILVDFDYDNAGQLQFAVNNRWIDVINSRYHLGVDGISLPLLALSALVTVLCVIYSWNHFPEPYNPKAFLALMLVLEVGMNGTFVAQDLILFFVFFDLAPWRGLVLLAVAGMTLGMVRGFSLLDSIRFGVAAGAAAVMTPGTGLCRREDAERLFAQMQREALPAA